MKKFFLSLISVLFVSMITFSLSSCSEDEVAPEDVAEALVGKWVMVDATGMDAGQDEDEDLKALIKDAHYGFEFKSNGKCRTFMGNQYSPEIPYTYDSTTGMLHIEDGEDWEYTRIVFINKNKFKMYLVDENGEYNSEEFTATFERD
ncbi:MAG: hypothetical protein IKL71_02880 [Bacteroidaceae bacterium]|nr:hypothetical protein [Bacteroidaceae bacterium]